ncbi:LysR family transcriptional regulator [Streptomyces sp. AC555_RSS877]|uniref:LysR family transcriptional regulator n=1 Tax=Streptomyces sp. AC555_RSS877 TaxID=2823688 RepID=UPI001C25C65F|nr:LysR family transcriptional regulator [Streptomyces sp. AC555_RSS877]
MRTEQLEYIAAVTRLGSLRRAAEELRLSQPGLSETVRNLEREPGVDLLERKRSGATMSAEGRELLPYTVHVLEAVDRLRVAAGEQHRISRMVRAGTVNAATVPLLVPVVRDFRAVHPVTQVEVVGAQQAEIHRALSEGGFDLGLVNHLDGDDVPAGVESTQLLHGRPVVCVRPDSPLASRAAVTVDELLAEPLIAMRSGYVMHRYVHRLLDGRAAAFSYSIDGAEMGKLMVAEGLGATVLPDFSVAGDPPPAFGRGDPHSLRSRLGTITCRPIEGDTTRVLLMLQRRKAESVPRAAQDLYEVFVRRARDLGGTLGGR